VLLSCSAALVGSEATQVFFDAIERLDLGQTLLRDWDSARLGDVMQFELLPKRWTGSVVS